MRMGPIRSGTALMLVQSGSCLFVVTCPSGYVSDIPRCLSFTFAVDQLLATNSAASPHKHTKICVCVYITEKVSMDTMAATVEAL